MLDAMLRPGELVGNFRILHQLGEGGMGIVYAAQHVHTDARAAIKVLTPMAARIPEIVQRFHNEAKAVASLNHDNIVRVLDAGRSPADSPDGQWYIALEFLDGVPLSHLMRSQNGPIEIDVQLKLIAQACAGLQAAHDAGIVHRDIKPDNVFVVGVGIPGADERVKVLDFGVAKLRAAFAGLQTKSHVRMGTPAYMAPEQLLDTKKVDGRADVYALGVIVYEMTTGVRPWGDVIGDVSIYELQKTQPALRDPRNAPLPEGQVRPSIPPAWAEVITHALALDPNQRYATPRDFALALARAAPGTAWRPDGMEIVRTYARSLTIASVDGDTAGRPLAEQAAMLAPGPITAPARPTALASPIVARAPGMETPALAGPHVPTMTAPSGHPSPVTVALPTTLGGAAAQSTTSTRSSARQAWMIGAAAVTAAGVAIAVVFLLRGGDSPAASSAPTLDAAPRAAIAAAVPMSALAVLSEPEGATITVDGVVRGSAPINVQVPAGTEVTVRAELAGHEVIVQTARIGVEPATVRLRLVAEAPVSSAPPTAPPAHERRPSRSRERKPTSTAADGPSAGEAGPAKRAPGFNPDDVPGD